MPETKRAAVGSFLSSTYQVHRARPDVWRPALAVLVLGLAITALFLWRFTAVEQEAAEADLAEQGLSLADAVEDAVDEVVERLVAVGSLYQGSEEVTRDEFRRFIANFELIPGMGGLGYMAVLEHDELAEFESEVGEVMPGFRSFEIDDEGARVPVVPRDWHAILQWFEPWYAFERPHGFDSTSEPNRLAALNRARDTRDASITEFLQLLSETETDGFLVYWPVADRDGEVIGFTVAPMDLTQLIAGQVDVALTDELRWRIDSIETSVQAGMVGDGAWATTIDVGGQLWRLQVRPEPGSAISPRPDSAIVGVVVPGVLSSLLAAVGVYLNRRKTETQRELDRIRDLARAKDQFLATVSHELRTPLTGVLGFAELLRDSNGQLSDVDRHTMIASVASEAADLSAIIDDLLVAARAELQSLVLTRVPVSLRAQVAQVLESAEDAGKQSIRFVAESASEMTAAGDPGRVRQIVRNLVTNASRYGGENVEIRFGSEGATVFVEVADDGPGVPDKDWERIFEPYYRVHEATTQPAALGIGLSVARHLASLMGGDLSYRREAGMSVFRLTLPAMPNQEMPERMTVAGRTTG